MAPDQEDRLLRVVAVWIVALASAGPIGVTVIQGVHPADGPRGVDSSSGRLGGVEFQSVISTGSLAVATIQFPIDQDWLTYEHDPVRSGNAMNESVLAPSNVSNLSMVWASDANGTLGAVTGSLTSAGGYLFAGSWSGELEELKASSGEKVWNLSITAPYRPITFNSAPTYWDEGGIASTPTVVPSGSGNSTSNLVYVTAGSSYLYAVNASKSPTGTRPSVLWSENTSSYSNRSSSPSEWGYHYLWSSPVVFGNYTYVGLAALFDSAPVQGQVLEIPTQGSDHRPTHIFNVTGQSADAADIEGSVWSTPAVDARTKTLWVTTGNNNFGYAGIQPLTQSFVALNLTNISEIKGSYRTTEPASGGGDFDYGAGPTLFSGANGARMVGAINKGGGFYAYNATPLLTGPCVNDSNLPGGHCLVPAWNGSIPKLASASYSSLNSIAPAAVGGGRLYVAGGNYAVGYVGGSITALDPQTGSVIWRNLLNGETPLAGLTYANGMLVYASVSGGGGTYETYGQGRLMVLNAKDGSVLVNITLNQSIAGEPIVSDGRIFVGTGDFSNLTTANRSGWIDAFGIPLRANPSAQVVNASSGEFSFRAGSTGGMPGYAYRWNFGDGSTVATGPNPVHRFPGSGSYLVELNVTDFGGESVSSTLAVRADVASHSSISLDPVDLGAVTWFNVTTNSSANLTAISWSGLPPGCPSNPVLELSCAPSQVGSYSISLHWQNLAGELGSVGLPELMVDPPLTANLRITGVPGPPPWSIRATVAYQGGTPPVRAQWTWGDGNITSSSNVSLDHSYQTQGSYAVSLTAVDAGGGRAVAASIAYEAVPLVTSASADPNHVDVDAPTELALLVSGGLAPYQVIWSGLPPGCESSDIVSMVCVPGTPGEYNVTVTARDGGGRFSASTFLLEVGRYPSVVASASASRIGGACGGPWTLSLNAIISGGWGPFAFRWTASNGTLVGTSVSNSLTVWRAGVYSFRVEVSDEGGGFANSTVSIGIAPVSCSGSGWAIGSDAGPIVFVLLSTLAGGLVLGALLKLRGSRPFRRGPAQ